LPYGSLPGLGGGLEPFQPHRCLRRSSKGPF
jgi:hypothetical protein